MVTVLLETMSYQFSNPFISHSNILENSSSYRLRCTSSIGLLKVAAISCLFTFVLSDIHGILFMYLFAGMRYTIVLYPAQAQALIHIRHGSQTVTIVSPG